MFFALVIFLALGSPRPLLADGLDVGDLLKNSVISVKIIELITVMSGMIMSVVVKRIFSVHGTSHYCVLRSEFTRI